MPGHTRLPGGCGLMNANQYHSRGFARPLLPEWLFPGCRSERLIDRFTSCLVNRHSPSPPTTR